MRILVRVLGYLLERMLQLADVTACRICVFVQVHREILQVVVRILSRIQVIPELLFLLSLCI